MEMFAKSMRRFNLHTPVTNVQVQIYDIEEGENMQQEHKKVYVIILQALRPPLKYCLFGIADPHYQQVGREFFFSFTFEICEL